MILVKIRKEADEENVRTFSKFEFEDIDHDDKLFTCVLCGRETSINNSCSVKGHLLVCGDCMFDYFQGNWKNVREWQEKELEEKQ